MTTHPTASAWWMLCAAGWPCLTLGPSIRSSSTQILHEDEQNGHLHGPRYRHNQSQPGVLARAHDPRRVSASFAWVKGVSRHQIVQTMFWKSSTVFINKCLFLSKIILKAQIKILQYNSNRYLYHI